MRPDNALPQFSEEVAVRVAGRLGMAFFLDCLRTVCDGRDLIDGLILLAVGQANLGHLDRAPELNGRYAALGDIPPADLIRPVSVSAVAASLRLPFETVRRRVAGMLADGLVEAGKAGVVVPTRFLQSDRCRYDVFALNQHVRALCLSLMDLGVVRPVRSAPPAEAAPTALVARLATEYCLRQTEALARHIEHPAVGVLLIHIIRVTTDHLDDTFTEASEVQDLVRDDLRRPVSVSTLAARAGLPAETARRYVGLLLERGWVARTLKGGLYLTREMLRGPPWPDARRENVVNLNRMMAGLAAGGALSRWAP